MAEPHPWTCPHCASEQTDDQLCRVCERPRFASWAIQIAEHVSEHLADGLSSPLEVLTALMARPAYAGRIELTLAFVASQIRLLTRDTTAIARALAKARAARTMLEVLETGDNKDKIAVMRGVQVLGDVVEHKGETVTRHIVELHEGPPPKPA